jgi:hypothetical protein
MLIDSSEYITIRRKNRFLGVMWKSGDLMATLGAVIAVLAPLVMSIDLTVKLLNGTVNTPFRSVVPILVVTVVFIIVAFVGRRLKSLAKRMTFERSE